jgi:hypothetical protein
LKIIVSENKPKQKAYQKVTREKNAEIENRNWKSLSKIKSKNDILKMFALKSLSENMQKWKTEIENRNVQNLRD